MKKPDGIRSGDRTMIAGDDVIRRTRGDKRKGREKGEMSRVTRRGDRAQLPGGMKGEGGGVRSYRLPALRWPTPLTQKR